MGQKVNPHGLRVGVIDEWSSKWYAKNRYFADLLVEDHKIREYVKKTQYTTGVSKVDIERSANKVVLYIYSGKPGRIIGRNGSGVEAMRKEIMKMTGKQVSINIMQGATLGFIGLGVKAPTPEWGTMLANGLSYTMKNQYMVYIPGIVLCLAALSINTLGDCLRDALDPQLKGKA